MKSWVAGALELLRASLNPPRHELNELDWKTGLTPDKKRLTEHLSAFALEETFGLGWALRPSLSKGGERAGVIHG